MKVYISASNVYKAAGLATYLKRRFKNKITIVSNWHDLKTASNPETRLSDEEKVVRAETNLVDLAEADTLILMDDFDNVPGGKHFELGYAHAKDYRCIVLGRREHGYCRLPKIENATGLQDLVSILKG